ncbi:MAG: response regulator [Alphaproteobacteria bacterium]|nr:response regulator [Alphaproteobacteria bacterium]
MAKILVLDDLEEVVQMLRDMLGSSGHDVTGVTTAAAARKQLETEEYDIFITDILMPGEPGYELIGHLRDMASMQKVPKIVAISGGVHGLGKETIINAVALKADRVLPKPFTEEDITGVVNSLLAA